MSMPQQKPHRSIQNYATPTDFVQATENHMNIKFYLDLAASAENAKAPNFLTEENDSFKHNWTTLSNGEWCWLNPPYANISDWAQKCLEEAKNGCKIVMLVPASVSTNWFSDYVYNNAEIVFIRPRLTFVGCEDPYPKDLMLIIWTKESVGNGEYNVWRWR